MIRIHMILLAAGNSRRFGKNKLLEKIGERPMYLHLVNEIEQVQYKSLGIKIVVSQYEEILTTLNKKGYEQTYNPYPDKGISYSIRLGIEQLIKSPQYFKGDYIAFFVCDQPYLTHKTIRQLFEKVVKSKKGIVSVGKDGKLGNPVVFRSEYIEELLSLQGDVGGKAVVQNHKEDLYMYEVDDNVELEDIDVPRENLVVIRGGGDLATGVIHRLWKEGYQLLVLEVSNPTCIRSQVSFATAIHKTHMIVEDVEAVYIQNISERKTVWEKGKIPIIIDPEGKSIQILKPQVVVDAIIAKRNTGMKRELAPFTVALGPGFLAGVDATVVIETMRGAHLGEIYKKGYAIKDTGIPGMIAGASKERVIHSPAKGKITQIKKIGDIVKKGEIIGCVSGINIEATLSGFIRGFIEDGFDVTEGMKIIDIDPRIEEIDQCNKITDKAHHIGGSVYTAIKTIGEVNGIV